MRALLRAGLAVAWLVLATLGLAFWWMRNPATFPPLPAPLRQRLLDWRGEGGCCEAMADFEALVVLAVAFLVVLAASLAGWLAWRLMRRR